MDIDALVRAADEKARSMAIKALMDNDKSESRAREFLDSIQGENPTVIAKAKEWTSRFEGTRP